MYYPDVIFSYNKPNSSLRVRSYRHNERDDDRNVFHCRVYALYVNLDQRFSTGGIFSAWQKKSNHPLSRDAAVFADILAFKL
jgi:hypothetical protein